MTYNTLTNQMPSRNPKFGKPTKRGTYKFTVEISDSTKPKHKSVTDTFTITIT